MASNSQTRSDGVFSSLHGAWSRNICAQPNPKYVVGKSKRFRSQKRADLDPIKLRIQQKCKLRMIHPLIWYTPPRPVDFEHEEEKRLAPTTSTSTFFAFFFSLDKSLPTSSSFVPVLKNESNLWCSSWQGTHQHS